VVNQANVYSRLGWPSRDQMMSPSGAGPRILTEVAEQKIGRPLRRRSDVTSVAVGVLVPNPSSDSSETPLAIVCEFGHSVSDSVLQEVHRLTWNFSKAPLLITVEPTLLRVWSCYQRPGRDEGEWRKAELEDLQIGVDAADIEVAVLRSLHWVSLLSGYLFHRYHERFRESERADRTLLDNLVFVRKELRKQDLPVDNAHDLLARIIFIQFLFQRQDASGQPALNDDLLQRLYSQGVLSEKHRDLEGILWNYRDAYQFFRWLNERFNGDLFPGKGTTPEERETEWQREMSEVNEGHLRLLAQFVGGSLKMQSGQYSLWPLYQFDAIPLEFISSIYEEFVKGEGYSSGAHYTPGHIVDFVLDGVLPWNDTNWNVKVLDPACGSGIFLVKAFQRLMYRWRLANGNDPSPALLSTMLTKNLFGVDLNPQAVRVASFSLYLAMCDAIDPRRYWQDVKFPRLRDRYLVGADFFSEEVVGTSTITDASTYDLVIGNAPWGQNIDISKEAAAWSRQYGWRVVNKDIGTLFLAKGAMLVKDSGRVAMLQSASSLLFNRSPTAVAFRRQFFGRYKVEEVVNFSALRFSLFANSVSPTVCITFCPVPPDSEPISYICLKPVETSEDSFRIIIEPHDVSEVFPEDAVSNEAIWAIKMWGGNRDQELIRRLMQRTNLGMLEKTGAIKIRKGVVWGDQAQKIDLEGEQYYLLDQSSFPTESFPYLSTVELPVIRDLYIDEADGSDTEPFRVPQLLIKKGWKVSLGRFQAVLHSSSENAVICNQSYVSVHALPGYEGWLDSAFLSVNSRVAAYYLMLTSGRFATYRPEPLLENFKSVPLPEPQPKLIQDVKSLDDVDTRINQALGLSDVDEILISDLFDYILPDFRSRGDSPARKPVSQRSNEQSRDVLAEYCETYLRVLEAGFGLDKSMCATIYRASSVEYLPVQLVAIHLDWPQQRRISTHDVTETELLGQLSRIFDQLLRPDEQTSSGIVYHRVLRWYNVAFLDGRKVPTVFLVKPNEVRYWLRSVALQDADKIASDLLTWSFHDSSSLISATKQ
jgi:hypothetical protein